MSETNEQVTDVQVGDVWECDAGRLGKREYTVASVSPDGTFYSTEGALCYGPANRFSNQKMWRLVSRASKPAEAPKHPERRPGQRWRVFSSVVSTSDGTELTLGERFQTNSGGRVIFGWRIVGPVGNFAGGWINDSYFEDPRAVLLADAPAEPSAPDRTKCKTWCGRRDQVPGNGGLEGLPYQKDFRYWDSSKTFSALLKGEPMWCSGDCRDARLPPIGAKAEAREVGQHANACRSYGRASAKDETCYVCGFLEEEHRKPAPPAKVAPACLLRSSAHRCEGPIIARVLRDCGSPVRGLFCELAMIEVEAIVRGKTGGHGRTARHLPERIMRPKMAHSLGVEDPCLEDVR